MGVVLLKVRAASFCRSVTKLYLKTPQLGATGVYVFDLLCRRIEQSCGATTQASHMVEWESRITIAVK